MKKYEIQTQFLYGWENVWNSDGELEYFDSYDNAKLALDDFFEDLEQDFPDGDLEDNYSRDDYRIVEVSQC